MTRPESGCECQLRLSKILEPIFQEVRETAAAMNITTHSIGFRDKVM